jgi:hypothetical protein
MAICLCFIHIGQSFKGIYTATSFTQPSDKLVAITGIISRIEKSAHLNTLAGLWKEILPAGLLWKADKLRWMPVFQEYRAWASLERPITIEFVKLVQMLTNGRG